MNDPQIEKEYRKKHFIIVRDFDKFKIGDKVVEHDGPTYGVMSDTDNNVAVKFANDPNDYFVEVPNEYLKVV